MSFITARLPESLLTGWFTLSVRLLFLHISTPNRNDTVSLPVSPSVIIKHWCEWCVSAAWCLFGVLDQSELISPFSRCPPSPSEWCLASPVQRIQRMLGHTLNSRCHAKLLLQTGELQTGILFLSEIRQASPLTPRSLRKLSRDAVL